MRARQKRFFALFVTLAHIAGALTSVQAVMETRTAQGAIAWAVSLNTIPIAAVPAYWAFGRTKFQGYVKKRQEKIDETNPLVRHFIDLAREEQFLVSNRTRETPLLERLTNLPATVGNDVQLLRNGEEIFPSIFRGMEKAEDYLLVQFYIVRDDNLGRELQARLLAAAQRGVRVKFLYDEIGSYQLPRSYLDTLRESGVQVSAFNSTQGRANPFQINFRNHRKIVVVDGRHAWVGGANVGDEYLGLHPRLTPWVDAMVKVTGPAVQALQVPFLEDWFWASGEMLDLDWTPRAAPNGTSRTVFILPTGPADRFETCALYFLHSINSASHRLWIASPYFVPDEQIVSALQLAALRGVDVRILVPEDCDNRLVRLSGWSYVAALEKAGVKVYRYTNGFLHHKTMLLDNETSAVGTANFDNRSFRLNFEITLEVQDEEFAREVEEMLLQNFSESRLSSAQELEQRSFPFRLAVRVARLLAPIQ
ncbi:cardiolipin synthetase [Geoalkalibacter ferrihydriticus DSM 17813]|uniref:Cardiolipin synthase n=1 Tax=Geoalkalibacter ferrihydriticus DSM 17813 TaxID=1121915 RepID=A0A0C2HTQ6_9BACT|nr:cardiolipin synthetase [Geoalkalibacter ferrihydriticus DSM 17813]